MGPELKFLIVFTEMGHVGNAISNILSFCVCQISPGLHFEDWHFSKFEVDFLFVILTRNQFQKTEFSKGKKVDFDSCHYCVTIHQSKHFSNTYCKSRVTVDAL